jgi:hypothetical protein
VQRSGRVDRDNNISKGDGMLTCETHCGEGTSHAIVPKRERPPEPRHFSASFHSTPASAASQQSTVSSLASANTNEILVKRPADRSGNFNTIDVTPSALLSYHTR